MYKLILLDYSLGGNFDGPDVAKSIRHVIKQAGLSQPFICCCSAYTEDSFKQKALQAGMNDYLTKPVTQERLASIVNKIEF